MNLEEQIKEWQSRFRVLDGWEITLNKDWDCARSGIDQRGEKKADIGHPGEPVPDNYILHEILHIAVKAAARGRVEDELLIQDLTQMLAEGEKAQRNYQFMVDRAVNEKLDGYRELGRKAAKAENALDAERVENGRLSAAIRHAIGVGHNDDCILCGMKDRVLTEVVGGASSSSPSLKTLRRVAEKLFGMAEGETDREAADKAREILLDSGLTPYHRSEGCEDERGEI